MESGLKLTSATQPSCGPKRVIETAENDIPDLDLPVGAGDCEAGSGGVDGRAVGGAVGPVNTANRRAGARIPDRAFGKIRLAAEGRWYPAENQSHKGTPNAR